MSTDPPRKRFEEDENGELPEELADLLVVTCAGCGNTLLRAEDAKAAKAVGVVVVYRRQVVVGHILGRPYCWDCLTPSAPPTDHRDPRPQDGVYWGSEDNGVRHLEGD